MWRATEIVFACHRFAIPDLDDIGLYRPPPHPLFFFKLRVHNFPDMVTSKRKTLMFRGIVSFFFCIYIYICMASLEQKHPQTREELSAVRLMTKALQWSFPPSLNPSFTPQSRSILSLFWSPTKQIPYCFFFYPFSFIIPFYTLPRFIPLSSFLPLPSERISYRVNLWQMRTPMEGMWAFRKL
jgi:hypothetical protein